MNKDSKEKSAREIYRHSMDRVDVVLNLFGLPRSDFGYDYPSESDFERMVQLVDEVVHAHRAEEESAYRTTILAVGEWLQAALCHDYLDHQSNLGFPSMFYAVRKGVEVLHCLLHRDLRRRVLSQTESQVVHEFVSLAAQFPNPCDWQAPRKKHKKTS